MGVACFDVVTHCVDNGTLCIVSLAHDMTSDNVLCSITHNTHLQPAIHRLVLSKVSFPSDV